MFQLRFAWALVVSILVCGCSSEGTGPAANGTGAGGSAGAGGATAGAGTGGSAGSATGTGAGGSAGAGTGGSTAGTAGSAGATGGAAGAGTGGGAGSGGGAAGSSVTDAGSGDGGMGWPAVNDYGAAGPFTVQRDNNTGPGGVYDIFRPATLGPSPRKHPIVSWANGTLFGIDMYQKLLQHWASHGFVVIAAHSQSTAGGGTHKAGIDWLVAESASPASIYFGLLDTRAIGASGHSQGGGATIAAGSNPATGLATTLPLMPILSFEPSPTIVTRQTAPMFNINATMDNRDPMGLVANQIYDGINKELVQAAFIGIHEDAMSAAMNAPTLAWFRLRLMGDDHAKAIFYPPMTCGLCKDPAWKQVRYKNTP